MPAPTIDVEKLTRFYGFSMSDVICGWVSARGEYAPCSLLVVTLLVEVAFPSSGFAQTAYTAKADEVEQLRQMVRDLSARVSALEEQARQQQELSKKIWPRAQPVGMLRP